MVERSGPGGVIHDLGYRTYTGPRDSDIAIGWALYLTGLRHVFGLGRSGRSKALPIILLVFNIVPAVVMVGTLALTKTDLLLTSPLTYVSDTQVLTSLFVATQAPVLFSRDLRSRAIVLYLARPLSSTWYVVARAGALATATLGFLLAPLVVAQLGSFFGNGDASGYATDLLVALPLLILLSFLLTGISGVLSAFALRRGMAVVSTIVVTVVGAGLVGGLKEVALHQGAPGSGAVAGLFSPWSLITGLGDGMGAEITVVTPPEGPGMMVCYLAVVLAVIAGCGWLLMARFAKAGSR